MTGGGQLGAVIGAQLGSGCGALALFLVSLLLPAQARAGAAWVKGVNGALWGALLGASAGALTGVAIHAMFNAWSKRMPPLDSVFEFGGFFFGSIAGFCLGMFIGAMWAGLSRKPFPFRTPILWMRAKMTRRLPQPVA